MEGTFIVKSHVLPPDTAFLSSIQDVQLRFTAYEYAVYGSLTAKLEHISADTLTDERGNSNYLIRIRTDRSYPGTVARPLKIIHGMTTIAEILTGEKTVLDYPLKPALRASEMTLRER
jgi:adhesin transport system membrane fusion protein